MHPVHSTKSRHDKESLAAAAHVSQYGSNSLLWPLGPDKPLFSVPVQSLLHLTVREHACAYRCIYELILAGGG